MRPRLLCCRGLALLVLASVAFLGINVLFLWNQCTCPTNCPEAVPGPRTAVPKYLGNNLMIRGVLGQTRNISQLIASNTTPTTPITLKEPPAKYDRDSEDDGDRKTKGKEGIEYGPHQLAVVVPFRNRFEEMLEFAPHIHQFLNRQRIRHQIWVINQADKHRFNRAALLNIGFLLSRNECDYIAMHDIDLLPMNDDLSYGYPDRGPYHVSSPELHPLYHYKTFVGGILLLTREQFEKVNGLSNLFWGWGREDDELYLRMKDAHMVVQYPHGITTGYRTFKHIHDKEQRPRDQKRYYNQWEVSRKRDKKTGVNTVKYSIVNIVNMTVSDAPLHFVNVELVCDYQETPFCDAPS